MVEFGHVTQSEKESWDKTVSIMVNAAKEGDPPAMYPLRAASYRGSWVGFFNEFPLAVSSDVDLVDLIAIAQERLTSHFAYLKAADLPIPKPKNVG